MNIPVVFLSLDPEVPARGYWDQGMLEDIFGGTMWQPATSYRFNIVDSLEEAGEGAIVVLPAPRHVDYVKQINKALASLKWVVLILTSDEEALFPVAKIKHPNMRIYLTYPFPDKHEKYGRIGTGYPLAAREFLPQYHEQAMARPLDYFFAGQITHKRRQQLRDALEVVKEFSDHNNLKGETVYSQGFTQGVEPKEYYKKLASAKIAPAPSGVITPDSFRLFEALEAGCIPIADTRDPNGRFKGNYWNWLFGEDVPFPVLEDYDQLQGYMIEARDNWVTRSNRIFAWWQGKKRDWCYKLMKDAHILTGQEGTYFPAETPDEKLTVIVPTSVIPNHPSTKILEETIDAVRSQLPDAEIIITFDGIRDQQKKRTADYEEYIRRALWLCNNHWHNVLPVIYDEHQHQARMLADVLSKVRTRYILYVEHDAPITPDRKIEWEALMKPLERGEADLIRLCHEELILPDYDHMMIDKDDVLMMGAKMRRTVQWSQRPHLASVAFYERILRQHFHVESRTMIEDVMHGVVHNEFLKHGVNGWYNYRLWIYCPDTDTLGIKRSYHTDGRGADPKYDMDIKPVEGENNGR